MLSTPRTNEQHHQPGRQLLHLPILASGRLEERRLSRENLSSTQHLDDHAPPGGRGGADGDTAAAHLHHRHLQCRLCVRCGAGLVAASAARVLTHLAAAVRHLQLDAIFLLQISLMCSVSRVLWKFLRFFCIYLYVAREDVSVVLPHEWMTHEGTVNLSPRLQSRILHAI